MSQQLSSHNFAMESSSTTTTGSASQQQSLESQQSFSQSSSSYSQSTKEVYEATSSSGAMRGYQVKGGDASALARDSGVFGGIGGDDNSLVDSEFDYKKHSVKDLAQHFALVKPKPQISQSILPEQKMYNGEGGPMLNYLGGKQDFASQQQHFVKKEISDEDIEASKNAYELKKKQQMEAKAQQSSQQISQQSSSTSLSQQSSVTMREKKVEETRTEQTQRPMSSALLMDPASAHANAGIIDPSSILRGEDGSINRSSLGLRSSVPGETELCASKWDNHNGIARGWGGQKTNYHPVTFRKIYNVDSQTTQNL